MVRKRYIFNNIDTYINTVLNSKYLSILYIYVPIYTYINFICFKVCLFQFRLKSQFIWFFLFIFFPLAFSPLLCLYQNSKDRPTYLTTMKTFYKKKPIKCVFLFHFPWDFFFLSPVGYNVLVLILFIMNKNWVIKINVLIDFQYFGFACDVYYYIYSKEN